MRLQNELSGFRTRTKHLALLGLCLGALGGSAIAGTGNAAAFQNFMGTVTGAANTVTVGVGTGGVPVLTTNSGLGIPWASVGRMSVGSNGSAAGAVVGGNATVPIGGSKAVVAVRAPISPAELGLLLSRGARLAIAGTGVLGAGMALYDAYQVVGVTLGRNSDGTANNRGPASGQQAYYFECSGVSYLPVPWTSLYYIENGQPTRTKACFATTNPNVWFAVWIGTGGAAGWPGVTLNAITSGCPSFSGANWDCFAWAGPQTIPLVPVNDQELADRIAAKSGWPTSDLLGRAIAQAVGLGATVEVGVPTSVSGPATVAGPVSTTASGTKTKTVTTSYVVNYAGDQISYTTTVVTTIYDSSTGITITETETKEADKPANPCELNPQLVGCAVLGDVPTDIPKTKEVAMTYASESLGFGSGACPASPTWTDRLGSHTLNLVPFCAKISEIVRPVVLLLGAFMALMVLLPAFKTA